MTHSVNTSCRSLVHSTEVLERQRLPPSTMWKPLPIHAKDCVYLPVRLLFARDTRADVEPTTVVLVKNAALYSSYIVESILEIKGILCIFSLMYEISMMFKNRFYFQKHQYQTYHTIRHYITFYMYTFKMKYQTKWWRIITNTLIYDNNHLLSFDKIT